ncbi:MAG: ion transporter [Roseburia sp.]|nr:ion transporter [Roseburia sp.]
MTDVKRIKKRVFEIIQIGNKSDAISSLFDYFIVTMIVLNIVEVVFVTFDAFMPYRVVLRRIEAFTSIVFCVEYLLRLWTADLIYPGLGRVKSRLRFAVSFYGIVDLLTFLPFFFPSVFATGIVAFRMLRVFRVFRLFKINAQYDAFHVVLDVLREKKEQLFSSICLILIMMLASSLCMYSLEHDAQPEVFQDAFSGIWWSVSTLLTVGYGDIYPITAAGKAMAIVIAFLGVGLVAIPTGIISAGFVERYTRMKSLSEISSGNEMRFIMLTIEPSHPWVSRQIRNISLPPELIVVVVIRNGEQIVIPNGNTVVQAGDRVVLGALEYDCDIDIQLKETLIKKEHFWAGRRIKDLDISENTVIVSVYRDGGTIIPKGDTMILAGDIVTVCEKR